MNAVIINSTLIMLTCISRFIALLRPNNSTEAFKLHQSNSTFIVQYLQIEITQNEMRLNQIRRI